MDGLPNPVLERIEQGSFFWMQAADLAFMRSLQSDALCAVVIGNECPCPDSCNGKLTVPA